jgi:hypothetical protein
MEVENCHCIICNEQLDEQVKCSKCKIKIHLTCYLKWNKGCPQCRSEMLIKEVDEATLIYLSENNNIREIIYLIKKGIKFTQDCIASASLYGHYDLVELFLSHNVSIDQNAIKYSLLSKNYDITFLLMHYNAPMRRQDKLTIDYMQRNPKKYLYSIFK